MKYIKIFEEYQKYEKKTRTESFTLEDAVNFYKKYCYEWDIDNMTQLYRGSYTASEIYYINPADKKHGIRKGGHGSSLYNTLFNYIPSWDKVPPRDKSLIMTTEKETADSYTEQYIHIMIPMNNFNMGMCTEHDIWESGNLLKDVTNDNWYGFLKFDIEFLHFLVENIGEDNTTYFEFDGARYLLKDPSVNLIKAIDIVDKIPRDKLKFNKHDYPLFKDVWLEKYSNMTLLEFLKFVCDFDKNGFSTVSNQNDLIDIREVWGDTEFIGIAENRFEEFKKLVTT